MPAFSLEPEHSARCAELRALAAERLRPIADRGEPGRVNRPLVAELGRLGLLARLFTAGALDLCLLRESLAYACTEAETALALQGLGAHPVHAHGTPAQRKRWLPRVADGSAVAAFALSEPGAGSDAAALTLRAEPVGAGAVASTLRVESVGTAAVASTLRVEADGTGAVASTSGADQGRTAAVASALWAEAAGTGAGVASGGDARGGEVQGGEVQGGDVQGGDVRDGGVRDGGAQGGDVRGGGVRGGGTQGGGVRDGVSLAAEPDGPSGWRLTGAKCWISNAPEADFYTVFARTTPGAGARGVTAFLVPADRPGLTGTALDMLSPHAIGALDFDAVPVTADDVLGGIDRGFRVAMGTLNLFRPSVGAFAVGMAQAALDATLLHTARRDAFGGKLRDLQTVAHQVAEMALRTEAARLMVYAAATAYDEGAPDIPRRAAMAKLLATETAQYVVDTAVQLHGARALERGHLLEHLYREVRAPRVYEGASEVQRGIIAKELYANLEAP
ncbi:acyl-CoA dehydrogenase family protein [Streptomyces adustus]|uniref:acyl-CoA dehydrogenase family protein n=1 Tax=Streptomyces adustus TaxID=1609272 RepID=UPI001EE3AAE8|nr:acyl-CoA dehydrogenase family protein [Streptomyces adustus]